MAVWRIRYCARYEKRKSVATGNETPELIDWLCMSEFEDAWQSDVVSRAFDAIDAYARGDSLENGSATGSREKNRKANPGDWTIYPCEVMSLRLQIHLLVGITWFHHDYLVIYSLIYLISSRLPGSLFHDNFALLAYNAPIMLARVTLMMITLTFF